jgi:hypothetical protein
LIAKAREVRMKIWMLFAFPREAGGRFRKEFLCVFHCFRAADHGNLDHISQGSLQRSSLKQTQSWIWMVMLVAKLQVRLVKYLRLELHPNIRSCASSDSGTDFF